MANLPETPQWEDGIYQIEVSDPVLGGPDGISNRQGKQLASRTLYLKQQVEKGGSDLAKHIAAADPHTQYAPKASPTLTGNPAAPTVVKTDNSTKLATTGHVKSVVADYAPLASPALTGSPTAPTAAPTVNNTQIATTAFVKAAIAALVASSPAALDTLNELAEALGNDPNFATTMTNALAGKQPLDNTLTALSGKSVAALLEYLGLGEAKYVTSRGSNANGVWTIWSDGAIELYGHTPSITDGLAIVTFPIALPKVIRHFTMAERLSGDSGSSVQQLHVSMIIDNTVTTSGFKARCQMATGAPSSNGFSWRAYCPPN
ncbi:phage tail protein [Cronobacter sakazakii]